MMQEGEMYSITVPASTANLGPGFDSIGLALGLYLKLEVSLAEKWEVIPLTTELAVFPSNEDNYIISVAKKVADHHGKELRPCRVYVSSDIPLTRGLGSSASAIVAGIELANVAGGLQLTREEKNRHASSFEGHPDNAGASVYGGLVVGRHVKEKTDVLSFPLDEVKVIAVIPDYELPTEESREVLPATLSFGNAVQASAVSNVLVAALLSKQWKLAGEMMKNDEFHQPFRSHLVPHLAKVEEVAEESGAFGTVLSGAGPTVISFALWDKASKVKKNLAEAFPEFIVQELKIDNQGSKVEMLTGEKLKSKERA
ncbi:homoserine kinase [Bacillus sp. CECT 9360]|uniref:homoserine kinase n=1 Tax=Bacillus sp. CECT 9360 TaxID=2845821 RepID=UPI001EF9C6D5|nr:Homoserine kinase [Bacillus sp. CECT 9360]